MSQASGHEGVTVTIVGIGLIGGSLAISLRANGYAERIIGVDAVTGHLEEALRRRLIDAAMPLDEALKHADLVVLATPVDVMKQLLPKILDKIDDHQVVMDVGSTKEELLQQVAHHPRRGRFVATHPMAGTEYSGPEAAIAGLFDKKYTVLCNVTDSDPDAVAFVRAMYLSIPMHMAELDARAHDMHAAYVSHISHISSFALALTVLEKERDEDRIFELASSGFSSTVRLAKSSADMWAPIFEQNRDNVLDVLDEHINQLARFRSLLIKRDFKTFYQLIQHANRITPILERKGLD